VLLLKRSLTKPDGRKVCIGLDKIVFYMSLNNIFQKFRFVKEEILQAVNGEAFLQHL